VSVVVLSATANAEEMLMENTINTGTMLIGEGALLPEPLRFESEPWAFFYMAGGIIRQLRKALEIKRVNALPPSMELARGKTNCVRKEWSHS
jgi:hypothetical protein